MCDIGYADEHSLCDHNLYVRTSNDVRRRKGLRTSACAINEYQEAAMKYLGNVKVTLVEGKAEVQGTLFSPLGIRIRGPAREHQGGGHIERPDRGEERGRIHHPFRASPQGCRPGARAWKRFPARSPKHAGEILEALFDNASRRQMTEVERKEKVKEKRRVQDRIYEENLIPELYEPLQGRQDRQEIGRRIHLRGPRGPEEHSSLPLHRAAGGAARSCSKNMSAK